MFSQAYTFLALEKATAIFMKQFLRTIIWNPVELNRGVTRNRAEMMQYNE